jgi:dTMP kinase
MKSAYSELPSTDAGKVATPPAGRGKLITFEGIDGSGKSTQARLLADALRLLDIPVLLTAEPSHGPIGRKIRRMSARPDPEQELELFTEDRKHHVSRVIEPALNNELIVICDRYVHSSIAYQGAQGIDPERIRLLNESFAVPPDRVFLLRIPVESALERITVGRAQGCSIFELRESLQRVSDIYNRLDDRNITAIDGARPRESIHEEILRETLVLSGYNALLRRK